MKLLFRFVDLLLYTSIFTACCAVGMCMATEKFVNNTTPELFNPLHFLLFGGTLMVYNAPRIYPRRGRLLQPFRTWYVVLFLAGAGIALPSICWLQLPVIALCMALALVTFPYSLPLLPFKDKKRLRDYGWLKILVLAGVWTVATSLLPQVYWHKNPLDFPFEALLRFVLIFTLCVVFDIRDMAPDRRNNIETLPHKIGIDNSYRIINTTLLLFVLISIFQFMLHPAPERLVAAWTTAFVAWLVVGYLKKRPSERAYMGLADGVMLVYATLILI